MPFFELVKQAVEGDGFSGTKVSGTQADQEFIKSLRGEINAQTNLGRLAEFYLKHNKSEEEFLMAILSERQFESFDRLLDLYIKQKETASRTEHMTTVKVNKMVNNIDQDDADYFLKISNKAKKEILKKIMRLNEDMRSQQKSLVNSKYTQEAVKKVIKKSEFETDDVKKRVQY